MTRSATIIAAELGAMLADRPEALALLRELLSADVTLLSRDASRDALLEARRAADRARQKNKRIQDRAAKQTMGGASLDLHGPSRDASKDKGLSACNLPSLSSTEVPERKREQVEGRTRGTRLSKDSALSTENRYFAAAAGIPEDQIDRVWAEFIDFWISVPGQRGTKLNWDATWRNRVRQVTPWKGARNGASVKPDLAAMCFDVADEMRRRGAEGAPDRAPDVSRGD